MHNALCDVYGIDVPIFAFSHSPAVVLAVTKAGGFGVLGAAGLEPEELDRALKKISQECAGSYRYEATKQPQYCEARDAREPANVEVEASA